MLTYLRRQNFCCGQDGSFRPLAKLNRFAPVWAMHAPRDWTWRWLFFRYSYKLSYFFGLLFFKIGFNYQHFNAKNWFLIHFLKNIILLTCFCYKSIKNLQLRDLPAGYPDIMARGKTKPSRNHFDQANHKSCYFMELRSCNIN